MTAKEGNRVYFVESLTAVNWFLSVLPFCMLNRQDRQTVYYIEGSWFAEIIAYITARLFEITVKHFQFRTADIRDEKGILLGLRVELKDAVNLEKDIFKRPIFEKLLKEMGRDNRSEIFIRKQAIFDMFLSDYVIYRALVIVQYVSWKVKKDGLEHSRIVLFMNQRLWHEEVTKYARDNGVEVIWLRPAPVNFKLALLSLLGPAYIQKVKTLLSYISNEGVVKFLRRLMHFKKKHFYSFSGNVYSKKNPRLAVEYYGQFNLDKPQIYSDLFFWQQSSLSGEDIMVTFNLKYDPLNAEKLAQLEHYNIEPVVLNPKASTLASSPFFYHWPPPCPREPLSDIADFQERKWGQQQIEQYKVGYEYWRDLFQKKNIKIYITWQKSAGQHCLIADALEDLGGISAIYQRSLEEIPMATRTVASDIFFAFSPGNAEVLQKSGSIVPYHVAAGYLGDHRFSLLKDTAKDIRCKLEKNGADFILTFFDENSRDDYRWSTGHEFTRQNYNFLLKKVFSEPKLGVIFKPKVPLTLRWRLGPIADLLKQAEQTGRCFVFEEGQLCSSYPPAAAALASDVTIHGHLIAATAGLESALAGIPTFLLDREGCPDSILYRLGKGKTVFVDWDSLWKVCKDYWRYKGTISGFGDWSALLDEMDPFRDGKAAERMGTYLKWILGGFKGGLGRDTVLADAADRYTKLWGKDKITEVKGNSFLQ